LSQAAKLAESVLEPEDVVPEDLVELKENIELEASINAGYLVFVFI
jgi:hypothetical protein